MNWFLSAVVGVLTAVLGLFLSGFVANLAVSWYRISSFEGGAGYFVVALALLGGIAGLVVGVVVSRTVGAGAAAGFLKSLGLSWAIIVALVGLIGIPARLLADIPPEIDGEELFLVLELRWPAAETTDPRTLPGNGYANLGSTTAAHVRRKSEDGLLFVDLAKQIEGRWVVPGAVRIFTSRGSRVLDLGIGEKTLAGFLVPLPGHPGPAEREWSPWMPRAREGSPPLPDQFTYRFRVIRSSEPVRIDRVEPFEIAASVNYFYRTVDSDRPAAYAHFRISYDGAVVPGLERAFAVATVGGHPGTLIVHDGSSDQEGTCLLVSVRDGRAHTDSIGGCYAPLQAKLITADSANFAEARTRPVIRGWIDRTSFATPGLYRLGNHIIDTRNLTFGPLDLPTEPFPQDPPGLISLSPDERSVVWFATGGSEGNPSIGVTRFREDSSYSLPIDRNRMRFAKYGLLDPSWLDHHFEWKRDPQGHDRLIERPNFVPLPYRGELTLGKPGEYVSYTLEPAGERLRSAIISLLVSELGGERLPDETNGFEQIVKVDGKSIKVMVIESGPYVSVGMDYGAGDPELMKKIAERLDRALATGKYDDLFGK